ncbi:hypothetical protein B0H12DRAFT_1235505 [Mycena haematopus]|nr:hypothetical protein B0H12DRAFT_1235505 [Mycena haematopus]
MEIVGALDPSAREKQKSLQRLKRKKCDGLEPCIFCTETGLDCSYSREPRRRGPPSGYLRFTETRVALLETLLGLYIQTSAHQTTQILHNAVRRLAAESKSRTTQDVWDAYKLKWTNSDASRAIHELAAVFAPFSPTENQSVTAKALLPLPQSSQQPQPPGRQRQQPRSPSPFPSAPGALYTKESFERSVIPNEFSPITERHEQTRQTFERTNDHSGVKDLSPFNKPPNPPHQRSDADSNVGSRLSMSLPLPICRRRGRPIHVPTSRRRLAYSDPRLHAATSLAYPYWPRVAFLRICAMPSVDLPPTHVRAMLLDTYRAVVHPAVPILSPTQCSSLTALEASPMLLLALCAYTARLAPPAVPTRVAADLWYESAFVLLSSALRRAVVHVDAVQTLLFLALRDYGRAREALAWRGVGAAIRIAVELRLDGGGSLNESDSEMKPDGTEKAWKRCLWGVANMLDLILSIQFDRAPASAEALRPLPSSSLPSVQGTVAAGAGLPSPMALPASTTSVPPSSIVSASADNVHTAPASEGSGDTTDAELAAHSRALVRIVARVHFYVVLGYGAALPPPAGSTTHVTVLLRAELAAWHRGLPQRFQVALGGERVPCAVLEVHMLYQVAAGILARGSSTPDSNPKSDTMRRANSDLSSGVGVYGSTVNGAAYNGIDAEADDAASTFNVLLDKYRPSLPLAGPLVVWLVFAAARVGLQRIPQAGAAKSVHSLNSGGIGSGTARALQTQLYLLNCREALASMGGTWEFARRCARTLERLMEGDGVPSRPHSGEGKRKRGDGEGGAGESGDGGSGGKRLREEKSVSAQQFDFDVLEPAWEAELDELWEADTSGNVGLSDTAEGLWGRNVFAGAGRVGESAGGSAPGLDPFPGG